ncbi:hypothetical protein QP028_10990 [Corynebacterium suedekumii]|nr:hypothetical protein QP028_10990 [Corynebacterium suedekumii]
MNDQTLTDTIASTHRSLTIHKARFILMIAEFHLRNLARKRGAPSTQVWLMRAHDLSRRTAYEYLHVGEKLAEFPLVAEAFVAGDLTYSKVRLLLRYLTHDNEPELVDLALAMCLSELEQQLAGRDRPGRKKPRNSFRVVEDEDTGGIRFWGTLGPEHAAEFQAALKVAELASLRDTAELDADALAGPEGSKELDKLIEQAQKPAEDTSLTRFGSPMFGGMLSAFLGMINVVRSHPTSRLRAPGAQVNVLMTLDQRAYIPERHGGQTGDLLRSVLNGDVRYHLLDKKGLHLKLTRAARTISPPQEKRTARPVGSPVRHARLPAHPLPAVPSSAGMGQRWRDEPGQPPPLMFRLPCPGDLGRHHDLHRRDRCHLPPLPDARRGGLHLTSSAVAGEERGHGAARRRLPVRSRTPWR